MAAGPHSPYDSMVALRMFDGARQCAAVDSMLGSRRILGVMGCHPWSVPKLDSAIAAQRATTPYLRAWSFARGFAFGGHADRAMDMLEQAYRDREAWMPFIQYDSAFRFLLADPRFQSLVRRVAAAAGGV
jgi:hypothetical protein